MAHAIQGQALSPLRLRRRAVEQWKKRRRSVNDIMKQ